MSAELRKKAAEMLLKGATLLAEPCPYCNGVRIMKDGNALCVNCGKEPDASKTDQEIVSENQASKKHPAVLISLKNKLEELTTELTSEKDSEKQQQILKSINSLIETIDKLEK
ncbi:Sjogren's syndrome/scleroderma autoantigen 1 family protein [Candidatus Nitrosotenuis chungbukensis]|uniref:Sjogren's syndrome/scleroderma autoantigen 1 family protein n=1 Tax=Candidatus Nitrosotenuis chungbukensis TaxID=1353246 RepID=UPI0005B28CE0|nr:Sjogren's syndrome/scleroderma autoantigen 1 family protein [Candidatus Nitrosotenuis chungbukensis]